MNSNFIINDDTLTRYFADELTADEQQLIEQWVEKSPENKKRFEAFNRIWDEGDAIAPTLVVDVNEAWKTVHQNINSTTNKNAKSYKLPQWLKIAAVIFPLLFAGLILYLFNNSNSGNLSFVVKEKTDSLVLSDGSKVIAMNNCELSYPQLFHGKTREVSLKGKAFFSIAHNKTQPFIVHAGGLDITVVGTEFTVLQQADAVQVRVKSGKVKVSASNQTVILTAGEEANYSEINKLLTETIAEQPKVTGYIDFNQASLQEVTGALELIYGVRITLDNKIKNCQITIRINKNESVETILQVIKATLDVDISSRANTIHINGEGC